LTLGEQQYFVWDTASQSTKLLDVLKVWGAWPPGLPLATSMTPEKMSLMHQQLAC